MIDGATSEIVLVDIDQKKAKGEAMDLNQGSAFVRPARVYAGDYSNCEDANIIIITAGAKQNEDESRLDLIEKNVAIFKEMIPQIIKYNQEAILLVVTNPVDILTYVTLKLSGFPANKVIGSGTVLDSARFRALISDNCKVATNNVHAYIIAEHGDSEVPVWSLTNIAGAKLDKYCPICDKNCKTQSRDEISEQVKNSAYKIIEKKGSTYYAIALAVSEIVRSIIRDENSILSVSSLMQGHYGIEDVCLSLPTIIDKQGINKVLSLPLAAAEEEAVIASATKLKEILARIKI